ncbi:dyslexia-associated protein KIAA0319-like protein homolog [Hemicordylus capensis]|uniref:dyslexia-associated protein KIAA0319-like protein homolog n=1 Tax=Hemicordylus capensis TaxID=884348 RepID=UPI0023037308|nr:dyslexia-associated protein KIAA0319-like protein homolog [Hemicordylus capensis]XP_053123170.1 dyslexia-associated protein KIAA0319-like protein homolog [Hemicordylus capensis]
MEKRLEDHFSISPLNLLGDFLGKAAKCLGRLHLLYMCACLNALCSSTDAGWSRSVCQPGRPLSGGHLRSLAGVHLQLLEGFHSVQSCRAACCRSSACDAFWLTGKTCIQVNCTKLHQCWTFRTDSAGSILMYVKSEHMLDSQSAVERKAQLPKWLDWRENHQSKARLRRSFQESFLAQKAHLAHTQKHPLKRDTSSSSKSPASHPTASQPLDSKSVRKDLAEPQTLGQEANLPTGRVNPEKTLQPSSEDSRGSESKGTSLPMNGNANRPSDLAGSGPLGAPAAATTPPPLLAAPFSSPAVLGLTAAEKASPSNASVQPFPLEEAVPTSSSLQGKDAVKVQVVTSIPTSIPTNNSVAAVPTSPAVLPSTAAPTPVIKKLIVSAGDGVEVTLPKNEVELNAYVFPTPSKEMDYSYDWRLITHPTDYSGEMEGKHSQILKLSKLTLGLYEFKVIVDGDNAHGEGMVNVTVKPEPRVNQPPVAIVSPRFLEISLPTTSTVIDGSQSTDDDKIVSYHWEELKGPLREEKVSADTDILKLTNLVPGNYTFSLTVVDSDGASNSTTASLTVNKAVDYPPVANAGPNQVITLPQNSITLYGNQSTDDHGIVSYEWSLSPNSKGKVVEMQGVRTSTLQLSAMREGDYTYQLTVTDSAGHQSTAEVTVIVQPENNKPPKADAGPDKELTLPVDSTTLDGSKSSDDQKITSYLWEKTQGPDGVRLENANSSIVTVTGLEVGTYEFTLTVKDERNLQSRSSVNVVVTEEINKPPVAKIAGNVVLTLPTNTAELDGSRSTDDKGIVTFLWTRDESSPAAGEVLNNSHHHPVLFLSNLVEGTYTFHLKVTDAKGESNTDRATVEVKPDPRKNNLVEMILDVGVSQLIERQKGMFIRQIAVLLGVLDSDITVQKIQPYTEKSTKMEFYVQNQPPHQIFKGYDVAWILKSELRKQRSDFLIFRALEINTVTCQLNCSEHGHCDSFTKRCICDPFWMENFIKVQMGDGESNCEWSVLYVVIASFVIVVSVGIFSWTVVCCCKRRKGKPKRKSKYKILDATDQESLELKPNPKAGSKQKAQVQNTSLMHSESELDSDEAIFTWPDREKGKLLRSQNGFLRNGQVAPKAKTPREEIL